MLVERLNLEVDPSVRSLIFTALVSIADTSALQGLTDCLRSEDVALRNDAVQALTQLPSGAASFIQHLLRDDDPDVRILAVNVLESLRHPQVEAWLIDVVEHDSHLNVCATAVDLLGEVGSVAAREPLSSLKRRFPSDAYIQFAADLALQRIVDA
jgi:HEAT repeat protein